MYCFPLCLVIIFSFLSSLSHAGDSELHGQKTVDISDWLIDSLKKEHVEIDIVDQFFTMNAEAVKALAHRNAEQIDLSMSQEGDGETKMSLFVGASKPNSFKFAMALPESLLDGAVEVIKAKLSQKKSLILFLGGSIGIRESECCERRLTIDVSGSPSTSWRSILTTMLEKLDDSTEIAVTLRHFGTLVVNNALFNPILRKQWRVISVRDNFTIAEDAFLQLKNNAAALKIEYEVLYDEGRIARLTLLKLDKKRPSEAHYIVLKDQVLKRDGLMALGNIANLTTINITGAGGREVEPDILDFFTNKGIKLTISRPKQPF